MSSFKTFNEWRSIKDLGLSSRAAEITYKEALKDPNFEYPLALHSLWHLMPGKVPHFDEIKPSIFGPQILPSMFIMDVEDGGKDFRWRLFGTDHAQRFGVEVTGKRMSSVAKVETSAETSLVFARKCYMEKAPVFFRTEYYDDQRVKKATHAVAMPLMGDSGKIERLFGCSVWSTPEK